MTEETQQAPAPESPAKKRDRHLYQIDFVRLVTFAGVILDHVAIGIAATTLTSMGALGLLLLPARVCLDGRVSGATSDPVTRGAVRTGEGV